MADKKVTTDKPLAKPGDKAAPVRRPKPLDAPGAGPAKPKTANGPVPDTSARSTRPTTRSPRDRPVVSPSETMSPTKTTTSTPPPNRPLSPRPNAGTPAARPPDARPGGQRPAPRPGAPGARPAPNQSQGNRPGAPRPGNGQRPSGQAGRPMPSNRPGQPHQAGAPRPPGQRTGAPSTRPGTVGTRPAPTTAPAKVAPPPPPLPIELPASITVRDLALKLKLTPIDIIKKLMANGVMANITQSIDFDTAALIASELGFEVHEEKAPVVEEPVSTLSSIPKKQDYTEEELKSLKPRPPVVTVMGHVDHGKTSLLDAIRNTNVVAGEFGGITQHIGAYQVEHHAKKITFLDTPGHEAFTAMRARGAKSTDIAIIVVAADDGVMPTTREAIEHARAAQVPIIVALNKIDRPTANQERVKQQLNDIGLEVYGGKDEVTVVPLSAKQRTGIEDLLENIIFVSELADLRANPAKPASGVVIESKLDKQQGPTATLLVQEGTLHVGEVVLSGETFGKVRAMFNERGENVQEATPATPVVVTGLADVPSAGDPFNVVAAEQIARARAYERIAARRTQAGAKPAISLNDLYARFKEGHVKELNLVIKADVAGSLEPIVSSLDKLGNENLHVKLVRQGIGAVTQADVMLAAASQGIIIAFNVGVEPAAETLAQQEKVDLRRYNIIYKLIEDIDKALKGMLEPEYKDVMTGRAQVLRIFNVKKTVIAGCRVIKGTISRGTTAKVMRDGKEIFSGHLSSLKRFQDDVKEVAEGYECGIGLEGFNDLKEGDLVEFYKKERVS